MRLSINQLAVVTMGILIALIVVQGTVAIVKLDVMHETYRKIDGNRLPAIRTLGEIDAQTTRYRLRATRYILALSAEDVAPIDQQLETSLADLQRAFATYEGLISSDAEHRLWDTFLQSWRSYEIEQGRALEAIRSGNRTEAARVIEQSRPLFRTATALLRETIDLNSTLSAREVEAADQQYQAGVHSLIGLSLLAICLASAVGVIRTKLVTRPIIALTAAMRKVADGDLDHPLPHMHSATEILDMKAALAVLRDNLAENERVRAEQRDLDMANLRLMNEAQMALDQHSARLDELVTEKTQHLAEREREIIWRLSRATERRDNDTGDHISRMSRISGLIAEALGLPKDVCHRIEIAAQMHDIGKVAIPDAILFKTGIFTPEERQIMETHVQIGWDILSGSDSVLMQTAAEIALTHHERWDGQGYPQKLSGDQIPLSGRIAAVADVFDALTSVRPYKRAWDPDEAVAFMIDNAGKHFDPECVAAFMERLDPILLITGVSTALKRQLHG